MIRVRMSRDDCNKSIINVNHQNHSRRDYECKFRIMVVKPYEELMTASIPDSFIHRYYLRKNLRIYLDSYNIDNYAQMLCSSDEVVETLNKFLAEDLDTTRCDIYV